MISDFGFRISDFSQPIREDVDALYGWAAFLIPTSYFLIQPVGLP